MSVSKIGTAVAVVIVACGLLSVGCSSESTNPASSASAEVAAGSDTDTGAQPTVTILRPTPNQEFKTTDRITLEGTGIDPVEGDIGKAVDATARMIWGINIPDRTVNPAGEGPTDSIGAGTDHPIEPGTYFVHFDVTNKRGQTGSAKVLIVVK
jgi:hypothetical protein